MELNVLAEELQECNIDPLTGFTRSGCCNFHDADVGKHLVCVKVSAEFLQYSKSVGNDLSTPNLNFEFPGLQPGDFWCLCASRWQQALEDGCPPLVRLAATHIKALEVCDIDDLKKYALDWN